MNLQIEQIQKLENDRINSSKGIALFMDESDFVNLITENIGYAEIDDFSSRFAGYNYWENGENIEDVLSSVYSQMPEDELLMFKLELVDLLQECFSKDLSNLSKKQFKLSTGKSYRDKDKNEMVLIEIDSSGKEKIVAQSCDNEDVCKQVIDYMNNLYDKYFDECGNRYTFFTNVEINIVNPDSLCYELAYKSKFIPF